MNKHPFVNPLRKFWRRKLASIKMPRERKRKIVDRYVFATMVKHKSNGVPTEPGDRDKLLSGRWVDNQPTT